MIMQPYTVVLLDLSHGSTHIFHVEAETPYYAERAAYAQFAADEDISEALAALDLTCAAVFPGHHPNCKGQHI